MPRIDQSKIICLLLVLIMGIGIVLVFSIPILHGEEMKTYYEQFIHNDILGTARIVDRDGESLYDGGYSENKVVRESTFHLIGDAYNSVPTSILSRLDEDSDAGSLLQGYQPDDQEIKLTIDLDLQEAAYEALEESGESGTIFVADYRTGEILCMASNPSVDVLDGDQELEDGAYLNKALQTYPPGSTFKAISVACLLEKGIDPDDMKTYNCDGKDGHVSCTERHGRVNLKQALYKSCNCAISYYVKKYLTAEDLDQYVKSLGVLDDDVIAGFHINEGTIDSADDLAWSADGQSKTLMSPVGLASFYAAIANGGVYQQFSLVQGDAAETKTMMQQGTADYLIEALTSAMRLWYHSPIDCRSFGKTGTAELGDGSSHAWFACCLNDEDAPSYVVVTMLEKAGSSSKAIKVTSNFINDAVLSEEGS